MKMIAVSSALTGLAKVWIRHRRLVEIWGTCTTHHLLYQTSSVSFLRGHPVVCRADSVLSQPLCSGPVHHQALTAPTFEYLGRNPRQLISLSGHRAIHGNCTVKVPMSIRGEGEQNNWLPFSPQEHDPKQKAWLSNQWHKNRRSWRHLLMRNWRFSAKFILSDSCPGTQVPYGYTRLSGLWTRGCEFID